MDISVLIATRNRHASMGRTLASFERMATAGIKWELLVADNGSTDDTPAVLGEHASRLPLRSIVVAESGKNRALNQLLAQARGRLLVFTDDDVEVDEHWLAAFQGAAERWPQQGVFAGRIHPVFPQDAPAWMTAPDFRFAGPAFARFDHGEDERLIDTEGFGPSFAVRATVMQGRKFDERVGPQAGDYVTGGETVLLREITADGHRTVYVPAASVLHYVRPEQLSLKWLHNRAYQLGRGGAYLRSTNGPRVGGAPLRLWFKLVRAWIRYRLSFWRSAPARMRRAETYFHRRGMIAQHRLQSRDSTDRQA